MTQPAPRIEVDAGAPPPPRVAVGAGSMAERKAPLRDKGFREAFAKRPGFEGVLTEDAKWNPALADGNQQKLAFGRCQERTAPGVMAMIEPTRVPRSIA